MSQAMLESISQKCIAFTRFGAPCPDLSEPGSKWCSTHEELQGKCMRIYKHHSRELDRYAIENPYPGFEYSQNVKLMLEQQPKHLTAEMIPKRTDVIQLDDVGILRTWYQLARRTWALANRTIMAREHHHSQFYQNGDDSHRHFNAILRHKQVVLEELMSEIDQRLFQLTIGAEEAEWLLCKQPHNSSSQSDSEENLSCNDFSYEVDCKEDRDIVNPPLTPPSSPTPCKECDYNSEDPEAKVNKRKSILMGQLVNYLDFPYESSEILQITILELKEIIRNIFRRIIVRDAGLFVRAKEFDPTPDSLPGVWISGQTHWKQPTYECPIKAFINSDRLSLKELERLWASMKFGKEKIGPELIRNSIADIYRVQSGCLTENPQPSNGHGKKSVKIWVLGGFIWRKPKEGPLPRSGSDFLHAFVGCAGCMLSTCRTFGEWIENRRLALVGSRYLSWTEPQEPALERLFRCLRIVVCRHNCHAKISRVEKVVPKCKKVKTVYTETQERHYLYFCMSLTDPRAEKVLCALHGMPSSFNVFAQRRDSGLITHKPTTENDLWLMRIRSGYSTIERKRNGFTAATALKGDKRLFEENLTSPEKAFKHRFEDCWDVLVMDAKVREFQTFLDAIATTALEALGCDTIENFIDQEDRKSSQPSCETHGIVDNPCLMTDEDSSDMSVVENSTASLRYCRLLFREPVIEDPSGLTSWW